MHASDQELVNRIDRTLTNHSPNESQVERIEAIRQAFKAAATAIVEHCPSGRHRAAAITHLENACMWSVKSIVLENVDAY